MRQIDIGLMVFPVLNTCPSPRSVLFVSFLSFSCCSSLSLSTSLPISLCLSQLNSIQWAYLLSLFTGSSAHKVHQSPSALIKNHGSSVDQEIHCSHSITNYDRMLWYKQDIHRTLKLLGYLNLNFAYSEEYVKGKIHIQGDGRSYGNFSISGLKQEDSAVYFCAVLPQCCRLPTTSTKTLLCLGPLSLSLFLSIQMSCIGMGKVFTSPKQVK